MDPVSQAILGTTICQRISKKKHIIIASLVGTLSAMSPDLDIFIRSSDDPLLFLEYHRQFSHSLFFIPFGGLICASFFYFLFTKYYLSFKETYLYSTAGYATHGLLDTFTTYGTQLLWPFTDDRYAWHLISIIDPLFTIPILLFCLYGLIKQSKKYSSYAIIWIFLYFSISAIQKNRAESIFFDIAEQRKHDVETIIAKPSFANIIIWKVISSTKTHYHVDAIKLGFSPVIYYGENIKKLNIDKDLEWLDTSSQQYMDLKRFKWFSNNYIALSKSDNNIVYDIRFSSIPYEIEGLWGVKISREKNNDEHIEYITNRKSGKERFQRLFEMIVD